jgi:acetyl esterase/lipase
MSLWSYHKVRAPGLIVRSTIRDTHDRLVRKIAVGAEAAVLFLDYARAPEARYPVAIEQAYAATRYVADNGASSRVDPLRLAVAGDSVGGNMAAAITLIAKATPWS